MPRPATTGCWRRGLGRPPLPGPALRGRARAPPCPSDLQLDPDPEVAAWQICGLAPISPFDKQRLLETDECGARLAEVAALSSAVADDVNLLLAKGL